MAPRRAYFYSYGEQGPCLDIKKYIQNSGILLTVRNLEESPLNVSELKKIIGYLDLNHFLNPSSESYKKYNLDEKLPTRNEVYKMIEEDYTLLKRPIIKSQRLVTVGCDKKKIAEMLQIGPNGEAEHIEISSFNRKSTSTRGSHGGKSSSRHTASSRK